MTQASQNIAQQYIDGGVVGADLQGQSTVSKKYVDDQLAIRDRSISAAAGAAGAAQTSISNHIVDPKAHPAQNVTYSGTILGATNVKQAVESVKNTLDQAMISGDSGPEALAARYSTPQNITYPSLKDRLDASDVQLEGTSLDLTGRGINVKYPSTPLVGAVGDGIANDTALIQAIMDAASEGDTIIFPRGVYIVTELVVNKSLTFVATGKAVIKFQDGLSANTNMFRVTKNGITLKFESLIFDGNKDNLVYPDNVNRLAYRIISWPLISNPVTSGLNSFLHVTGCKFLNTTTSAIYLVGYTDIAHATPEDAAIFKIDNNYFEKGFENDVGYVDTTVLYIFGNSNGVISDNNFIKNEINTKHGLGAITVTTADNTVEVFSTLAIKNNYFHGYGRQGAPVGLGGIGVIDFYASCKNLIIEGNRIVEPYNTSIKGKTNSRNVVVSNNIIDGCIIDGNTTERSFGIAISRGTLFGIYDKYIITSNIIKNIYGRGIDVAGAGNSWSPEGNVKDVLITGNEVDLIQDAGTVAYGVNVSSVDNATITDNIIRNNKRGININYHKLSFIVANNQLYNSSEYFIAFQGFQTGEAGYTDYDANAIINGNLMRGSDNFRCIYLESMRNALVEGNMARIDGAAPSQYFLLAGSNVLELVAVYNNILTGVAATTFVRANSGTLVKANNYNATVAVP